MKIEGIFILAIAIMAPGIFLSHPPIASTPSILWALHAVSIESAITSLETREYFMPSVPIEIPSLTVIVPNIWGIPPDLFIDSSAFRANLFKPILHGVMVLYPFATPIIGLLKSSSLNPTALNIDLLGDLCTPWVIADDLSLFILFENLFYSIAPTLQVASSHQQLQN